MKRILILGSTGSIGTSTLDVVDHFPDRFPVAGLSAGKNAGLLLEQAKRYRPGAVAIGDPVAVPALKSALTPLGIRVFGGPDAVLELIEETAADLTVNALVGAAGLLPTMKAIERGMDVALANKESLVMAGALVMERVRERGVRLLPVDSEHSAIWQCLAGSDHPAIRRLMLTASGGPFVDWSAERMASITPKDALDHPTWNMGPKVTVDSATMMNKGLEIIEAHWLFDMAPDHIQVVVHRQSIVHSLVEFVDGSTLAQLSPPDMRLPIQLALTYPERWPRQATPLDLAALGTLSFESPDRKRFPCLNLAYQALGIGGTMPAVLNAANEVAVRAFLDERIPFTRIAELNERTMARHEVIAHPGLEDILKADRWASEELVIGDW
ncbi:MAG: 1-deoxy-D-xylulose-5-phosphate reductoisomerase [Candidatus Latescibacteria bacterium 4484_107]|nr:MAG: 1-deoxy-D-xylulose-5-phosphate reductoisomerase [Candidatus Latescibacteria bacterium 4484_107]